MGDEAGGKGCGRGQKAVLLAEGLAGRALLEAAWDNGARPTRIETGAGTTEKVSGDRGSAVLGAAGPWRRGEPHRLGGGRRHPGAVLRLAGEVESSGTRLPGGRGREACRDL